MFSNVIKPDNADQNILGFFIENLIKLEVLCSIINSEHIDYVQCVFNKSQ